MPNMTQSKACQTCKDRRIKCDEGLPICQRCVKSRRGCSRPDTSPFAIVSENKYAGGTIKRPRGPRLRKAPEPVAIQDVRSEALKYYLENHVIPPTNLEVDICGSLSACVLAWQDGGHSSAMVDLALSSMALAVYARTRSSSQAAAEAYVEYQEVLKLLQGHIARPTLDAKSIDACLLTVFLMGRCESTMHKAGHLNLEAEFKSINSWSHHDGALALLKLWYMHLKDDTNSTIVKQTRRGTLKSLLLRRRPVPKWLQDGCCFGEQGAELVYDRILARLVNLRSVMGMQQDFSDEKYRDDLTAEAVQLAHDLRVFIDGLPGSYIYRKNSLPSDQDWIQGSGLNTFATSEYATVWAHLFATRLIVDHTNIQILQSSLQTTQTETEVGRYTTSLRAAADDLAATVPQCMELIHMAGDQVEFLLRENMKPWQASRAVWPMTIAISVPGYSEALRHGFIKRLAEIGKIVGDGVLQAMTADEWPSI